jgi:hypothetical protein
MKYDYQEDNRDKQDDFDEEKENAGGESNGEQSDVNEGKGRDSASIVKNCWPISKHVPV